MTPEEMAALHALCFTTAPRPWSAAEFAGLVDLASTLVVHRPDGFALGQIAGPESTLLTLAVRPEARRKGVGRGLVLDFETAARGKGAAEAFLEVAENNMPARALYDRLGYLRVGARRGYYHRPGEPPIDGLVLRKPLGTRRPGEG